MLDRIAHATDFSAESNVAFLHALRMALAASAGSTFFMCMIRPGTLTGIRFPASATR